MNELCGSVAFLLFLRENLKIRVDDLKRVIRNFREKLGFSGKSRVFQETAEKLRIKLNN